MFTILQNQGTVWYCLEYSFQVCQSYSESSHSRRKQRVEWILDGHFLTSWCRLSDICERYWSQQTLDALWSVVQRGFVYVAGLAQLVVNGNIWAKIRAEPQVYTLVYCFWTYYFKAAHISGVS